jgi:hypothetical protein
MKFKDTPRYDHPCPKHGAGACVDRSRWLSCHRTSGGVIVYTGVRAVEVRSPWSIQIARSAIRPAASKTLEGSAGRLPERVKSQRSGETHHEPTPRALHDEP